MKCSTCNKREAATNVKTCQVCLGRKKTYWLRNGGKRKPLSEIQRQRAMTRSRNYYIANKEKTSAYMRNYCASKPEWLMWHNAHKRAAKSGRPFLISQADIIIPEFCPALGVKLERGTGHSCHTSPTLDAIIPELGYIPGNVAVISRRANLIKQDVGPSEIRRVALWLESQLILRNLPQEQRQ